MIIIIGLKKNINLLKSKIIIFGSAGLLGKELKVQKNSKFKFKFVSKKDVDITNYNSVKQVIEKQNPNYIINCAALTDVDYCESNKKLAYMVNSTGTENIVKNIKKKDIVFIHLSTDYVFNNQKNKMLVKENYIRKPISTYGKSKLLAEKKIINNLDKYIIIRTSWLYGKNNKNFLSKIYKLSLKNKKLSIIFDQYSLPTYVVNLAKSIYKIISILENTNKNYYGVYQYCDSGKPISRYDFAKFYFKILGKNNFLKIEKISYKKFYKKNIRPINSAMSSSKITKIFNIKALNWRKSLLKFVKKEIL